MTTNLGYLAWGLKQDISCLLSSLWSSLERSMIVVGRSRAAAELTRMGYHEEAKRVMLSTHNSEK